MKVAEGLLAEEVAASTANGYNSAQTRFREYCEETGREALPAVPGGDLPGHGFGERLGGSCADGMRQLAHFHRKKFLGVSSPT